MNHCYVIASGPSLLGFDFDALPEGTRIGANRSSWLANCDLLVTVDKNFHRKERERITEFGDRAYVALSEKFEEYPDVNYWAYAPGLPGLALAPNTLGGSNSGFAALNLAVQLGFTEIALLGFDYRWVQGRSHFHEGYNQRAHIERQLHQWSRAHDNAAPQLRAKGVNVTNFVGPMGSMVKAYPTAPLSDLL